MKIILATLSILLATASTADARRPSRHVIVLPRVVWAPLVVARKPKAVKATPKTRQAPKPVRRIYRAPMIRFQDCFSGS